MKQLLLSREAARIDNSCAMAYWGQALAMGPGYNSAYGYAMGKGVPAVIKQMNDAAANASPKERELIAVMQKRYNTADASDAQRKQLNNAYAEGMKQLMLEYPDDNDIKALYIDAVMLIHAWNFWNPDGTPQPWTPELVTLSEGILKMIRAIPAHCIIISMLQKRRVIQWWRCQVPTRSKVYFPVWRI